MTDSVAPAAYIGVIAKLKDESVYTKHAQTRLQQRVIPGEAAVALIAYGERRCHRGADIYYLNKAARSRVRGALGQNGYKRLSRSLDSYFVMNDDSHLITAARRQRRLKF